MLSSLGGLDYPILPFDAGMMLPSGFQLGDPNTTPLPDEESSPRRKREVGARGAGPNKAAKAGQDPKKEIALTYGDMQALLAEQAATILAANREHAQGLLDALEVRHGGRLDRLENGADKLAAGMQGLEDRLAAIEKDLRAGLPQGGGARVIVAGIPWSLEAGNGTRRRTNSLRS